MTPSILTRVITPLAIGFIMFGMGLSLTPDDFRRVWKQQTPVFIGIALQILGLPVLGLAFAALFDLPPVTAASVMILSACPGGAITNLVTYICRGDAALSVSLTALNSLITMATIPVVVTLALGHFLGEEAASRVNAVRLSLGIILITVPPIILGMITRQKFPGFALRSASWVKKGTLLFLVLLAAFAVHGEKQMFMQHYKELLGIALGLCLASMLMGALSGRLFSLPSEQVLTLAIEVGMHNSAMGIVIAISLLEMNSLALFSAFYLVIEYILAGVLMGVTNRPMGMKSTF